MLTEPLRASVLSIFLRQAADEARLPPPLISLRYMLYMLLPPLIRC